jgi:hypothetical protein
MQAQELTTIYPRIAGHSWRTPVGQCQGDMHQAGACQIRPRGACSAASCFPTVGRGNNRQRVGDLLQGSGYIQERIGWEALERGAGEELYN